MEYEPCKSFNKNKSICKDGFMQRSICRGGKMECMERDRANKDDKYLPNCMRNEIPEVSINDDGSPRYYNKPED